MAKAEYSLDLCRELTRRVREAGLATPYRAPRYEDGDVLDIAFATVWPEVRGSGRFRILKFVGGGFAGQVYRCALEHLEFPGQAEAHGLRVGGVYAVKMMIPPSRGSTAFRNLLYWIGFQAPFSAQVNEAACRVGLLWQKMARLAMQAETGRADAVADVYASFFDAQLGSFGEIREWIEGRTWRLEPDVHPGRRRRWRTVEPADTGSPEYVAKRKFMDRFVRLLHRMGAPELARQYEWWTMKSQPNVLKRSGAAGDPAAGLCAVDFRAGLTLLPFLPMSPRDAGLILEGICRGSLVQFDRWHYQRLRRYAAETAARCPELVPLAEAAERYDRAYRRSMPDVTHQGLRLLASSRLRQDVRRGLCDACQRAGLVDAAFAERLSAAPFRFALFQSLMIIPVLGRLLRALWGRAAYRRHARALWTDSGYLNRTFRAGVARRLVEWHRAGRTGEARTRLLAEAPCSFWLQRLTLGWLPAGVHRIVAEPSVAVERVREWYRFMRQFYRDAAFREQWLARTAQEGHAEGMLDAAELRLVLSQVKDVFIAKYLKCLAVHIATLPVSEVFWTLVGGGLILRTLLSGGTWHDALAATGALAAVVILVPISPGSLCRGLYVTYLMIRERNFRDYMIAGPFSLLKIVGYLAFPIQMVTTYPVLARFMAARWATDAVHVVPVFGENGALLEHAVFDMCFNLPRAFGVWAGKRMKGLLDLWLLAGLVILGIVFGVLREPWHSKAGLNTILAVTAACILPRVLFYPMLKRSRKPTEA